MSNEKYLIGVDVGSASTRAGVFDRAGNLLGHAKQSITTFRAHGHVVEQSANEIWQAVSRCVREAVATAAVDPAAVAGIGFDATCSLVVIDDQGQPLPVSPNGEAERNIIMWMDHRATQQADAINATKHPVLDYVGGRISPEMEMPKLLWLKTYNSQTFQAAVHFFDLTDYLSWRASGDSARSSCTVTCKWNYLAHEQRWDSDYFHAIGLPEFAQEKFARIGQRIVEPGTPCGSGLTAQAAADFGLPAGTPVAAGLIDAHAGGVGTLGADGSPEDKLAYVFGTSSCTMTPTREAAFVPGVWGPYYSAMVPGLWLSEGGQSAAGAAIDRLLEMHPAAARAQQAADAAGLSLPVYLAEQALQQARSESATVDLVEGLHIVPEFAGNRAPFGDPYARAVICGLGMDNDEASLIALYIAGLCSLGYGLRQIIEAQTSKGIVTRSIVISGGAGQHSLVRQLLADSCQLPVQSTHCPEPVLLGSAILAATASGVYSNVTSAMANMTTDEKRWHPKPSVSPLHQHRYDAFKLLQSTARNIRQMSE